MHENIILDFQKEFLSEAASASKLFRGLGKVEQYIAESYKTRSFIELIQNADDANSSAFGIYTDSIVPTLQHGNAAGDAPASRQQVAGKVGVHL